MSLPKNVSVVQMHVEEIKKIAAKKLGFAINLDNPSKFCDLKPAYGFLFSEYTAGYDFWGYCDIDIIFGNIRHFITNRLLSSFDVITVLNDFLAGYFSIFRNTKKINTVFKQSKDYRKVFTSAEHFCFDECNFLFQKIDEGFKLEDIPSAIESMTHVIRRLHKKNYLKVHFDTYSLQGTAGKLKWQNGILMYKNRYEIILYHLIQFKKNYQPVKLRKIPDTFRISKTRIYWP